MADVYDFGQTVTVTVEFVDVDGDPVDPTHLTLMVKAPSGEETTYLYSEDEITKVEEGSFAKDINPGGDGRWYVLWDGETDDNHTVVEYYFYVMPSEFSIEVSA